MSVQPIASKFRRALRKETGATFTYEQMRRLGECGVLRLLAEIDRLTTTRPATLRGGCS